MMLADRDVQILQHIVRYCQQIDATARYFQLTKDKLKDNFLIQNAISMPILQIGELANHFSKEFLDAHADVPWRDVVGMRNIFAHDYEKKDITTIWMTVKEDVPFLCEYCTNILLAEEKQVPTEKEI